MIVTIHRVRSPINKRLRIIDRIEFIITLLSE
jgi:hypothetical protein